MKRWIGRHETAVFLIITYGISWPLWLISGALLRTPVRAPDIPWLVAQIGVFAHALAGMALGICVDPGGRRRALRLLGLVYAPAVALGAWIATRGFPSFTAVDARSTWILNALALWILVSLGRERNRLVPWTAQKSDRTNTALWSAGSLLAPPALFLAAWAMTPATAGPASRLPVMPVRELTPLGVLASLSMNLAYGGSLGEEPGWRGAWLSRLLQSHTPFTASLIISFWWALWHAPIDLSQGFGFTGIGALVVRQITTLPMAIVFTWVTLRAGGSLLPPLLFHASLNAIPDFALGQPVRYERAFGVFLVLLVIIVLVAAMMDPRFRGAPHKEREQSARSL